MNYNHYCLYPKRNDILFYELLLKTLGIEGRTQNVINSKMPALWYNQVGNKEYAVCVQMRRTNCN